MTKGRPYDASFYRELWHEAELNAMTRTHWVCEAIGHKIELEDSSAWLCSRCGWKIR